MKKRTTVEISVRHPAAYTACGFMTVSAAVRLCHYLVSPLTAEILLLHLFLPVTAALLFVGGILCGGQRAKYGSAAAVVLGVTFFILKAFSFAPLHQALCTILYLAVLSLYTLTVLGYLPTKKLLYPLFGLPLLYHIFVEDMKLYVFAEPPVPVWDWMPEISVLCIMAALFSLAFAIQTEKIQNTKTEK